MPLLTPSQRRRAVSLAALSAVLAGGVPGCVGDEAAGPSANEERPEREREIRDADQAEVRAILEGDREAQDTIWGEDLVVTNMDGRRLTKAEVVAVFEAGIIPYRSLERETDLVRLHGDLAVSLGTERAVPAGPPSADPEIRRYTHVWVPRDGRWELTVRHAGPLDDTP